MELREVLNEMGFGGGEEQIYGGGEAAGSQRI